MNDFTNDYALHDETLKLVKEERRLTGLVIENLQKIQDTKLYLKMGFSSVFEYAVKALGYSESCAYRRLSAAKIARALPEIKEKLNSGDLNLTNLSLAQSFFTKEKVDLPKQKDILEKIENCSKRETEKILVQEFGPSALPPKRELVQSSNGDEALLHVRLSQKTLAKLDRLKNLRAHRNPSMTYAELIDDMCEFMLKKLDPLTTKNLKQSNAQQTKSQQTTIIDRPPNPRYIPATVKRKIWQRDEGRCTYFDSKTKRRCESRHLLQLDHIKPVSCNGEATEDNLRLLCHAHHSFRHQEV